VAQRDAILDAAFAHLVESGPALPASEVARRAGASKALLFHHFGTREGLLDAMAQRVLEETQAGLDRLEAEHVNPRERVLALADVLLEDPGEAPIAQARHVMQFWLAPDATGAPRWALRDALVRDFVEESLREARALGLARAADPARVATTLLSRWHGATALNATGSPVDFEAEAEALRAQLEAMLG